MLQTFKNTMHDELLSKFNSDKRELRQMYLKIKKEIDLDQKNAKILTEYVDAIKKQDSNSVGEAAIKYSEEIRKEMALIFEALHRVLQLYYKLISAYKKLVLTFKDDKKRIDYTLGQGVTLKKGLGPDDFENKLFIWLIDEMDKDLELIKNSLDNFLSAIAGIESLTINSIKLNDFQSALRKVMYETRQEIQTIKSERKEINELLKNEHTIRDKIVKEYKGSINDAMKEKEVIKNETQLEKEIAGKLNKDLKTTLDGLNEISGDMITILSNKIYSPFSAFVTGKEGFGIKNMKLSSIRASEPPSLNALSTTYSDGGFGFPKGDVLKAMDASAAKTEKYYRDELKFVLKEIRVFESKAIQAEQKA
jgi:hypothetical protein